MWRDHYFKGISFEEWDGVHVVGSDDCVDGHSRARDCEEASLAYFGDVYANSFVFLDDNRRGWNIVVEELGDNHAVNVGAHYWAMSRKIVCSGARGGGNDDPRAMDILEWMPVDREGELDGTHYSLRRDLVEAVDFMNDALFSYDARGDHHPFCYREISMREAVYGRNKTLRSAHGRKKADVSEVEPEDYGLMGAVGACSLEYCAVTTECDHDGRLDVCKNDIIFLRLDVRLDFCCPVLCFLIIAARKNCYTVLLVFHT